MKKLGLLIFVLGFLFAFNSEAQTWETDYDAAVAKAKKENKTLLVNFTGSDWCGWCIKLKKEVFTQEEFKAYAEKNLVLVMLDFPRYKQLSDEEKKQNNDLATKHGIRGFPTVLLLDKEEKVILRTGYQAGGPDAYVKHLKAAI